MNKAAMKNTCILFDFDGTLFFGTANINYHVINASLEGMGLPKISFQEANSTVGDTLPDACRRILKSDDAELVKKLLCGMKENTAKAIGLYAEIEEDCAHMLRTLAPLAPLAICSNAEEDYLSTLLDKFGVRDCFAYVSHYVPGCGKKDAIPKIKRILGAQKAIMVGDRAEDVSAGKACGCITVAIQNDYGARDAHGADFDVYNHKEMEQLLLELLQKNA